MNATIRNARRAVLGIFFINGWVISSWVPHIPLIQGRMELSDGTLGIALLSVAAGAVLFMPLTGRWSSRFGSKTVTFAAASLFCLAFPLPILAPNWMTLLPALILFGASNGAMDVAMNAQAVTVEKKNNRPIMSTFHGLFSLGGLCGSGLGGFLLSRGLSPALHAALVSITAIIAIFIAQRFQLPEEESLARPPAKFVLPTGPLRTLGLLAFLALLAEGAVTDWSSVYIKNVLHTGVGLAAAGYAVFSLLMAAGRLAGDRLVDRMGAVATTRITTRIAVLGMGLALLIPHPATAIIGFGLVGLGLSNLIPVLFSAAGRTPGVAPGIGISAVATAGYFGLLAGPPLIGFIAQSSSLTLALGVVALAILTVSFFARQTDPTDDEPERPIESMCNELN